jgi:tetratricopeptide (TPR) repeat protein
LTSSTQIPVNPDELACVDAYKLARAGQQDQALQAINAVIAANPRNVPAYMLQGQIYSGLKRWNDAQACYEAVLKIDDKNVAAKFDISELKFLQKDYAGARPGFLVLKDDPNFGDFISYKIFLCDLFSGKEDVARNELDAFNQVGSNASYYFGNAAWSLYHHQDKDARSWLQSGFHIYAPAKIERYIYSLKDLGYLPLPAPKPEDSP